MKIKGLSKTIAHSIRYLCNLLTKLYILQRKTSQRSSPYLSF